MRRGFAPPRRYVGAGFTLTEILVAMLVLSLTAMGVLGMFVMGKKPVSVIGKRTEGANFAREAMEHYRSMTWAQLADTGGAEVAIPAAELTLPANFATDWGGQWFYRVDDVDLDTGFDSDGDLNPANDADCKRLSIRVEWNEVTE